MKVETLFFGRSRDLAGTDTEAIVLGREAVLSDLLHILGSTHGPLLAAELERPHIILINGRDFSLLGGKDAPLKSGDQVAIFPVAAGG
jgi:molybdopterin converting factor small subunit